MSNALVKTENQANGSKEFPSAWMFGENAPNTLECGIPWPGDPQGHNMCHLQHDHDLNDPHEDLAGNRWYGSPA